MEGEALSLLLSSFFCLLFKLQSFQKKNSCSWLEQNDQNLAVSYSAAALHQIEGDSLLCGGITLMTHFKEQRAYAKPREVSRNLKFVTNNTTNVCFDFRGGI